MADDRATVAIDIPVEDSGVLKTADELSKLNARLREAQAEVKEFQAQKRLLGKDPGAKDEIAKLNKALKVQEARMASAARAVVGAGGKIGEAFKAPPKPPTPPADEISKLTGNMALAVAGGQLLASVVEKVAAGLLNLGKSAVSAAIDVVRFGLSTADSARAGRLELERMILMPRMFAAPIKNAEEYASAMDRSISAVAQGLPQSRAEVSKMAQELFQAGLRGHGLEIALRGSGLIGSTQRFLALGGSAMFAGKSIKGVADFVEKRFGGVTKRELLSWDVQMRKIKDNMSGLFRNLDVSPMLSRLKAISDQFSDTTYTGHALKEAVSNAFKILFGGEGTDTSNVHDMVATVLTGFVKMETQVLKFKYSLQDMWKGSELAKLWEANDGMTLLTAGSMAAGDALQLMLDIIGSIAGAIDTAVGAIDALADALGQISGGSLTYGTGVGADFARGVAAGIKTGTPDSNKAANDLALAAYQASQGALQAHSPSVVMRRFGREDVGGGFALGLGDATPRVEAGSREMARAVPRAAESGGGTVSNIRGGDRSMVFNISVPPGTKDPHEFGRLIGEGICLELERANIEQGAAA